MTRPYITYPYRATGGTVARTSPDRWADLAGIKDFGAVGNGTADDTAAIQAAIDYAGTHGGGVVFLPAGTYKLGKTSAPYNPAITGSYDRDVVLEIQHSNVTLRGAGVGATILTNTQANTTRSHLLKIGRRIDGAVLVHDVTVEDLSLVGTWLAPADTDGLETGTGIDVSDGCTGITLQRLHVSKCSGYGIGFQRSAFSNCTVRDCVVTDTGADGIDFKMDVNASGSGNLVDNVVIMRPGLDATALGGTIAAQQAGLDIRQGVNATNVTVLEYGQGTDGVRVDSNVDAGDTYRSMLANIKSYGNGDVDTHGISIGQVDVQLCNVYATGAQFGYWVRGHNDRLVNCTAEDCTEGFAVFSNTGETIDNNSFVNCRATTCGKGVRVYGAGTATCTSFVNLYAVGNTLDVELQATSVNTTFTGGEIGTITNVDLGTRVLNVGGQVSALTVGRDTNQHVLISGDGSSNIITGVSNPGSAKNFIIEADAESVDLVLRANGAGKYVRFGVAEATADAPITAYITIKDDAGAVRKLAVIA